jgi:hypothetical protein
MGSAELAKMAIFAIIRTMSKPEKRGDRRVEFSRGPDFHMAAIDATWRRPCVVIIIGSVEGLDIGEFFLVLSGTGLAFRHCELAWINGAQLGVRSLGPRKAK